MRHPFIPSIIMCLLFIPPWASSEPRSRSYIPGAHMTVRPVALFPDQPDRRQLGALTYLGGIRLIGNQAAFGGFSSMVVDGNRITLLSDGGNFVRFRLSRNWKASDIEFGDLPDGPGLGWRKADRDSESMTVDPANGELLVGFENSNEIWRYTHDFSRAIAHSAPPSMASWELNTGPEAMTWLKDGRVVVLGEEGVEHSAGLRQSVMFAGDPVAAPKKAFKFSYKPPVRGETATDVRQLPDGRLLVINRSFSLASGFVSNLSIVDLKKIKPGATVSGTVIARFVNPAITDNFEALDVTKEGQDTIIWIASDDNQSIFQQSLLLKFRLDMTRLKRIKPRRKTGVRQQPTP